MHIPTVQSLICISLLAAPYVSAFPLDENLQPRAATTCNASNVKTLKNAEKQPVAYCKSWLASKHSKSTVKGLTVAQVSNACKCVQASASSSSAAAAKKTAAAKKVTSSARKITSTRKTTGSKKATTSIKKAVSSTKKLSTSVKKSSASKTTASKKPTSHVQSTGKKTTTSKTPNSKKSTSTHKTTARSTSVTSEKSTWTPVSTEQSSSSSSSSSTPLTASTSSLSSSSVSLTTSLLTGSSSTSVISDAPITTSSTSFSQAKPIPTDPASDEESKNAGVTANQKLPSSVSTRSSSSVQMTSSGSASSQTTSASTNSNAVSAGSTGDNVIMNGNFSQGSVAYWHGAHAINTKFSVASLAGDSNYEALVKYSLNPNDNASGQLYQNVSIPAGSAWQLGANVYLNYPSGLPAGVSCVIKYSLGSDSIILKQYGVVSTSGSVLSDTASGQLSQAFNGRFQIDTYCNSISSSAASFALGFDNIQLLISKATSATSSASAAASTSSSATSSTCAPSVATNTNLASNGNFNSGSLSGWTTGASTIGSAAYSVQARSGTSDNYAVMKLTPGSYNEANGQMSQNLQVISGYVYNFSADVYFNLPSGLPSGAVCTVTYQIGDTPIYGYQTDRVTIDSNNHISDSRNGTISTTDCSAALQIYVDCTGISSAVSIGFDNVQFNLQAASSTSASSPSSAASSAPSASATKTNLITNGDFGTGDYTGWALYRLGSPTFAIQGNSNAYVSVISFPAGGDANSQAGLMQQAVTVKSGKTYTMSMGLLLDYPSALPADGSTCTLQVYLVDANGFGILFAQTSYTSGDAAFQSVTGSGTINNGFDGNFDILLRCYGGAQTIVAGVEDVQVFES